MLVWGDSLDSQQMARNPGVILSGVDVCTAHVHTQSVSFLQRETDCKAEILTIQIFMFCGKG